MILWYITIVPQQATTQRAPYLNTSSKSKGRFCSLYACLFWSFCRLPSWRVIWKALKLTRWQAKGCKTSLAQDRNDPLVETGILDSVSSWVDFIVPHTWASKGVTSLRVMIRPDGGCHLAFIIALKIGHDKDEVKKMDLRSSPCSYGTRRLGALVMMWVWRFTVRWTDGITQAGPIRSESMRPNIFL